MCPENRASGLGDEAQGGRNRRQEGEAHRGSLRKHSGLMSMFIILIMVMVSQVYFYQNESNSTSFKYVHFTVCQLYFNEVFFVSLFLRHSILRILDIHVKVIGSKPSSEGQSMAFHSFYNFTECSTPCKERLNQLLFTCPYYVQRTELVLNHRIFLEWGTWIFNSFS